MFYALARWHTASHIGLASFFQAKLTFSKEPHAFQMRIYIYIYMYIYVGSKASAKVQGTGARVHGPIPEPSSEASSSGTAAPTGSRSNAEQLAGGGVSV